MAGDFDITVSRPYRGVIADVPAQVIVASLPQMAEPLIANTYSQAQARAKLRRGPKRLRFVEAKLELGGFRLRIIPKGPLAHLLDQGVKPHSLAPKQPLPPRKLTPGRLVAYEKNMAAYVRKVDAHPGRVWAMHPGFPGRHFMPAALQASLPAMQRILDHNTATFLAKIEERGQGEGA